MGDVLSILRLLGIVLSGVFGVLGLLTEYKDKDGKVTRWGKTALAGICLSTVVALAAGVRESRKATRAAPDAERQTRLQLQRSNEILADLGRTLDPLTNIRISFAVKFPLNTEQFATYRNRLAKEVNRLLTMPVEQRSRQGVQFSPDPNDGKP